MTTVYILEKIDFEYFTLHQNLFKPLLSFWERFSIERSKQSKDKIERTLGWILCRMEASKRFSEHPAEVEIFFREKGKPYFGAHQNVGFNITHGGNLVIVAFSDEGEVGVDVEAISRKVNLEIAERHFTPAEAAFLRNIPPKQRIHAFLRFWTVKEAYLKMIGTGLTRPLSSFEIQYDENEIKIYDHDILQNCTVIHHEADKKHIITVCVEGVDNYFQFIQVDMQSIINFVEKYQR